jgi:serine/threonine protein kinase
VKEDIELNTDSAIRAPEQKDLLSGFPITEKVDIYALGCLAYEVVFGRPFDAKNPIFTFSK